MQKKRMKQIRLLSCIILLLVVLSACRGGETEEDYWGGEQIKTSDKSTTTTLLTPDPTANPAKPLSPFLGTWELSGNRCSFSVTENNTVLYTDHTANRHATCSYEYDAKKQILTLRQIDSEADGASLKSGGMICVLEDENHMKKTFLDGKGAMTLTRVAGE